jgi:adenylate cyclase
MRRTEDQLTTFKKRNANSPAGEPLPRGRLPLLTAAILVLIVGAGSGVLHNLLFRQANHVLTAMIYGLFTASFVIAYESGLLLGAVRRRIQLLPSLFYILASEIVLVALVALGNSAGGLVAWGVGEIRSLHDAMVLPIDALVYSLIISAIFVFVMRLRSLLGAEIFRHLLLGRYHRPVTESLDRPLTPNAMAICARNSIWARWLAEWKDAACVACLFAILDDIRGNAQSWRRRFGQVPQLRAALHGGSVVTVEIGIDRHKITYFGDVVNTTSRLDRSLHYACLEG